MRLGLLGFGNVHRAFVQLLIERAPALQQRYGLDLSITGIMTRSRGYAINPAGLDLHAVLAAEDLSSLHTGAPLADSFAFITACPCEVILEGTVVNPHAGQPATDYVRAALQAGKHVVTANKGPVAFAYPELSGYARAHDLAFFFESTVMDGKPIHSMVREGYLGSQVTRIRGLLNSTTNYILTRLSAGIGFEDAIREAQALGIAEADPSNDIDGWDAAIKIAILANTMMGADLRPVDVDRTGIRGLSAPQVQSAYAAGQPYKLMCEAVRDESGVRASVKPLQLSQSDPFAHLDRTSSGIRIESDLLPPLTILGSDSSPRTTAYGMLVDTLNIGRGRR